MRMQSSIDEIASTLVSVDEACAIIGCSRMTLYRYMDSGKIESVRVAGHRAISLESVRAYRARKISEERTKAAKSRRS